MGIFARFITWTSLVLLATTSSYAQEEYVLPDVPDPDKEKVTEKVRKERIDLGKHLYFDARLSADGKVSCNSCHRVEFGRTGTDNLPTSEGIKDQVGDRNAPTVWNSAYLGAQFWDGREATLEDQAKGPITNPIEMGEQTHEDVIKRLKKIKGYVDAFARAFPDDKEPFTTDNLAKAIATFERTLVTPNSPFDRWASGKDKTAISRRAEEGFKKFENMGCVVCHFGPNFANQVAPRPPIYFRFPQQRNEQLEIVQTLIKKYDLKADLGRFKHTKKETDKHKWRVPSLRNTAVTGPYFHNGKVSDLKEAIRIMGEFQTARFPTLKEEEKNEVVEDIYAFLVSLTGEFPRVEPPKAYQ